jgi:ATP-dependent RNA helicase RhlE
VSNATSFSAFSLPQPLSNALTQMGFENPTPVQDKAIPVALDGRDIVSLAETGSGKTAAYLIPTLSRILNSTGEKKQILILVPTRELAVQVVEVAKKLSVFMPQITTTMLIGGVSMSRQIGGLKRIPNIVIATPGRLIDLYRRRSFDLKNVDTLILDEADRMFDIGFAPQVREIVRHIPKQRQTMLFSATMPKEIRALAQEILIAPVEISVQKETRPPAKIRQNVIDVAPEAKDDKTLDLVNAATGSVLIFTRTKHRTDRLAQYLDEYGVKVARLHGNRSQGQRNQAIQGFKTGEFRVLVATDIAARGIDVATVSDVINYDLPENFEDYVHRIGRTGRAGREGQASTLVTSHDRSKWMMIAKKIGMAPPSGPRHHRTFNNNQKSQGSGGFRGRRPQGNSRTSENRTRF